MGNLISKMKEQIAKSGASKKDILYFGKDAVKRIRFLQELDDGFMIWFHNDYGAKIMEPCHDQEDHENCKLCQEGVALQQQFVWSVWDYDSNAVRLLMFKASGVSPIPSLIEMSVEFDTIMDRDYKIKKVGQGTGGSFVVTPLDKERFTNKKAKPYNNKQVLDIISKAYETDSDEDNGDENEEEESKKKSKDKKKSKKKKNFEDTLYDLDFDTLSDIAKEMGMSKKEIRGFDESEDLADELVDTYEIEDIEEVYEQLMDDEED